MVDSAYQVFVDVDATALEGGYVYVGQPYDDPETSPVPTFWDAALTIPAAQPLRTSGGYIVRDGAPANVYSSASIYSIRVRTSAGGLVYYVAAVGGSLDASRLRFPIAAGPASTVPGPSNNTRVDLAALKAAMIGDKTSLYDESLWTWTTGDFTGKADDINIVKSDTNALSVGAWVRTRYDLQTTGLLKEQEAQRRPTLARGSASGDATIAIFSDSFSQNSSIYFDSFAWQVPRSVLNAADHGAVSRGFGYHTVLNLANLGLAFPTAGFAGPTGFSPVGLYGYIDIAGTGGRVVVPANGAISMSGGFEVDVVSFTYNASNTTAGAILHLRIAGIDFATYTIPNGLSGLQSAEIAFGKTTKVTDNFDLYNTGGQVEYQLFYPRRSATTAPRVYMGGRVGMALQDHASASALDEIAHVLNRDGAAKRTAVFGVVPNDLYRAERALTPAQTVATMETIRAGLASRVTTGLVIAFTVPAKASSAFPIILAGYTHQDYVNAILAYAATHQVALIRQDQTAFTNGANSLDGLHPDKTGHLIYSAKMLETLGVPFDSYSPVAAASDDARAMMAFTSPWTALNGGNFRRVGGRVIFSGTAASNGATSGAIGVVPVGFRPNVFNRILPCANAADQRFSVQIAWNTGVVTLLGSTIPTNIDLGGLAYDIEVS